MKYIPKLHIHQHSLLTRKYSFDTIFNTGILLCIDWIISSYSSSSLLSLQVFFVFESSSSSSLQVIFFFKSSSSRDLHHHDYSLITAGSSLDLDCHQFWIIITFGSSLDLDCHQVWIIITSGSSLDLDRHQVWIIITCYLRMVLSRFFSSQEVL